MDLARLYPAYEAELDALELQPSYAEDKDLEAPREPRED
jgi:hypothetical protein